MSASDRNRVCPAERAGSLDNVIRRWLQNPDKILRLYVRPGMKVLDIGCGPGFFSTAMARMVGRSGRVIAADLQPAMLDRLKAKIIGTDLTDIVQLHLTSDDSLQVSEEVDFVLAFYVVHEVPNQRKLFTEIASVLRPGARVLLVEPKFHVSARDFERTLMIALDSGLVKAGEEKVFFSRTAVLKKA